MKHKTSIKAVSIVLAVSLIFGGVALYYGMKVTKYEKYLTHMSDKAFSEIISSLDTAANSLSKMQYATKGSYMNTLAASVWKESASAKAALSLLPLTDVELEETQTFIAKAGAYAYSLLQRGVTDEAKENIQNLSKTAEDLTKRLWEVKQRLNNGEISFETLGKNQSESDKTNVGQDISVIEQEFQIGRAHV